MFGIGANNLLGKVLKSAAVKRGLEEDDTTPLNMVRNKTNDAMDAISSLGNVTPSNIGQSILNQAQSTLSEITNPRQTINNRFIAAVNDNSRGKLSTIRDIKSGMPTPGSNNPLRSVGSNVLSDLGQENISTPPPKPMKQSSSDEDLLDFLEQLSAQRTGFPLEQRKMGGPTEEGEAYIVGEDGPEIFVSPKDGEIIPNPNTVVGEQTLSPDQLDYMRLMRTLPPGGVTDMLNQGNKTISEQYLESIQQNPDF